MTCTVHQTDIVDGFLPPLFYFGIKDFSRFSLFLWHLSLKSSQLQGGFSPPFFGKFRTPFLCLWHKQVLWYHVCTLSTKLIRPNLDLILS